MGSNRSHRFCYLLVPFMSLLIISELEAQVPSVEQLAESYRSYREKWDDCQYRGTSDIWLDRDEQEILIERKRFELVRKDERIMRHTYTLTDPKNLPEVDVHLDEQLVASAYSELESRRGQIRFSRSHSFTGEPGIESNADRFLNTTIVEPWTGSYKAEHSNYPDAPGLVVVNDDVDIESKIRDSSDPVVQQEVRINGISYRVAVVGLSLASEKRIELFFDLGGDLEPIGMNLYWNNIQLPDSGGRPVPDSRLTQWPKNMEVREFLVFTAGEQATLTRERNTTYHDGHSDKEITTLEITDFSFGPDDSSFTIPVHVPNGTPVTIVSSQQIKAEWRDEKVVHVYRGEVIDNFAMAEMVSQSRWWPYLLIGFLTIIGAVYFFWRRNE